MKPDDAQSGAALRPTANVGVRRRGYGVGWRTAAISSATGAALATIAWLSAPETGLGGRPGRAAKAEPTVLASPPAQDDPATAALVNAGTASKAAPPVAIEEQADIARQLADLKSAYDRLSQQSRETDQRLDRIEADVAELKQQFDRSRAAQAKTQRRARALAQQLRAAQAAATEAPAAPQLPSILSVDTWDGRPSVSVQTGTEIRFLAEGDTVDSALLRKADPATQRVEFVSATGALVHARSAAGEGR
jgi:hypothetical protein